ETQGIRRGFAYFPQTNHDCELRLHFPDPFQLVVALIALRSCLELSDGCVDGRAVAYLASISNFHRLRLGHTTHAHRPASRIRTMKRSLTINLKGTQEPAEVDLVTRMQVDQSVVGSTEIDESLYSRQLYVLGHEAM